MCAPGLEEIHDLDHAFVQAAGAEALEVERGEKAGKPREKFTRVQEMLDALA